MLIRAIVKQWMVHKQQKKCKILKSQLEWDISYLSVSIYQFEAFQD